MSDSPGFGEQSTPRYWVIAPVEAQPPEHFDKVWQFDLANNLISIGWSRLGDVSKMSREELSEAVAAKFPEAPASSHTLFSNMIWAFFHEIAVGDFVIARRGTRILAAVGRVSRIAFYAPGKNPAHGHAFFLEVSWQEQPRDKKFDRAVFPIQTLIGGWSEEKYQNLLEGVLPTPPEAEPAPGGTEDTQEFVLEKYLQEFIVDNFDRIFKKTLKIYDEDGIGGREYDIGDGRIDILAVEIQSKSFVVIELKKGRPSYQVVGQILRYMGWVKKSLCKQGEGVKGIVICSHPDGKLSDALEMTSNIDVRYYSMSFSLSEVAPS